MSKVYVARKCFNCGAILQNESPEKEGYTSKKDYNSSPLNEKLFCDECQNEADYVANTSKVNDDLLLMMKDAAASDALIVYIINLFSFESSFIPEINQIINRNNILVIANKIDLFTNNSDDEHLKEYVAHRFRIALLSLKSSDVLLTSIASFGNIDKLKEEILKRRKGHDVYVISSRGAGKRMFFSSFLCNFKNNSNRSIKTKACKGAIIPVLQIPLDNSSTIYDTPYLPSSNSIDNKLEKEISESLLFS